MVRDMARKTDRPERLAEAAERLFAERGYAAVAIRDVAAAADLPAGNVFYHYPRKADLAVAVARRHVDGIQGTFGQILAAMDRATVERLAAALSSEEAGLSRRAYGIARLAMELASEGEDAADARMTCLRGLKAMEDGVSRCLLDGGVDARVASSCAARFSMAWLGASLIAKARDAGWWERSALPEVVSILREANGRLAVAPSPHEAPSNDMAGTSEGPGPARKQTKRRSHPTPDAVGAKSRPPAGRLSADAKPGAGSVAPPGFATPADVLNAVGRILDEAGKPLQRRELLARIGALLLAERGLGMPGRDPYENLLTIVSKDRARTYVNLSPHGIWIRARPYAPYGYAPGAAWKRGQAPAS
ncbi:TetR/AcrR family transcriptional regulator [Methylobacterium sp. D54C]